MGQFSTLPLARRSPFIACCVLSENTQVRVRVSSQESNEMFRLKQCLRLFLVTLAISLFSLPARAMAARGAPPAHGLVVDGHSAPGVALSATRTKAYAAWGNPSYCQSVDLTFTSPIGGNPTGGGSDVIAKIDWIGIPGWHTTAGVSTSGALANPQSVGTAYPQGKVVRYGDGNLYSVTDNHPGIQVLWIPLTYSNGFYVEILIYPGT
jgi:hypothetical protein